MNKEKEIDMLKEKLDYYTLVATDEEFDAEEVIKIVKRLEELEPTEAPEKSVDEFLDDFWKYCEETIGVGVNEKAVLRFYQTALSFTSISIFPW